MAADQERTLLLLRCLMWGDDHALSSCILEEVDSVLDNIGLMSRAYVADWRPQHALAEEKCVASHLLQGTYIQTSHEAAP